jgi:large subunit ribosomal protein L16
MLQPKRVKYRRPHIIKYEGKAKGGTNVDFGEFGIEALEGAWITDRQIEAARRAITREMKRAGRLWIRIFPDVPVTDKPAEVRMGKGKGAVEFWVARVKPGRIMFEIADVDEELARRAFALGAAKLPVKSKFVKRLNSDNGEA